tara:strand:+ start:46532 stop:47671 length:1140 start_codon:yes stop_codon:yes gene_type:complete
LDKIKSFLINYQAAIFGFLILSLSFDFIDKIEIFYKVDFIKFNRILKGVFLIYSIVFILSHVKYVQENLKILLFIIILLSIVYVSKGNFSERYFFEYLRYVFILLVFPLLHYAFENRARGLFDNLYKFFKWLILINAVLVLVGILFEVKLFQTYQFEGRFAYNGLILSQGFTPFFYLSATTIFWVRRDNQMLLLLLLLCCLSGLKGVYFGECLLLSLLILSNTKFKKRFKTLMLSILLLVFTTLLVTLLVTPMFVEVSESKGLLSAISSYRTENVLEVFNQINDSNFNIIIGALETEVVRLEMQIFDIILFFGASGLVAYFLFLQLLYKKTVKGRVAKVFFATSLSLSVLSGNLLYIPLSSILMFLVLMSLHNQKTLNN